VVAPDRLLPVAEREPDAAAVVAGQAGEAVERAPAVAGRRGGGVEQALAVEAADADPAGAVEGRALALHQVLGVLAPVLGALLVGDPDAARWVDGHARPGLVPRRAGHLHRLTRRTVGADPDEADVV